MRYYANLCGRCRDAVESAGPFSAGMRRDVVSFYFVALNFGCYGEGNKLAVVVDNH